MNKSKSLGFDFIFLQSTAEGKSSEYAKLKQKNLIRQIKQRKVLTFSSWWRAIQTWTLSIVSQKRKAPNVIAKNVETFTILFSSAAKENKKGFSWMLVTTRINSLLSSKSRIAYCLSMRFFPVPIPIRLCALSSFISYHGEAAQHQ